ncbi:GNAT family N-acetyltransferase [Roseovarius sp. CAU 1744]|uniref:GNAT family N-acetyltransferase n=1 Tax=Roseovarius sp. CAU 1744 TaxID=3140368 RepID=UPI00325B7E81
MTSEDMAALHAYAFAGQGRAWSVQEFAELMQGPHVFVVGDQQGFALGRVVVDEAELLTIVTDPGQRRQGLARANLRAYESEARRRGAMSSFLEVARDNGVALALYRAEGYAQMACRTGYYRRPGGEQVDALILRKPAL